MNFPSDPTSKLEADVSIKSIIRFRFAFCRHFLFSVAIPPRKYGAATLSMSNPQLPETPDRRTFCKGAIAACIGGCVTLAPIGAGLAVWLDPLNKKGS
ncbi:MAG: hypothetical protein H7X97_06025, partial [Opitutaceae bacterium]|nr:hypothetical protein [Verrucomicrobiales bacterium]